MHIVDSLTYSISEGLLVRVATLMRDEGKTAENIALELGRQRNKVHIVALVDALDYLSKGGRMPKAFPQGNLLQLGFRFRELCVPVARSVLHDA